MGLRIILLAKQVPDTRNVGKDAMKEDGTINRGVLPAIFNPEDLNALEQALRIKDNIPDTEIILITMGPPRAAEIIREGLYRGIDKGYLLTDRKFAGSDTLATSYVLSLAIKKLSPFDLIIAGRQAIDGDTAQVGPQTAEKLKIPQITYTEEILEIDTNNKTIKVKRRLERGIEIVKSITPALITVNNTAPACRNRNTKLYMKYKHSRTISELQDKSEDYIKMMKERPYLTIEELSADDIGCDVSMTGLSGSPTKVKKIESVVLGNKENRQLTSSDNDIETLVKELIDNHIIG